MEMFQSKFFKLFFAFALILSVTVLASAQTFQQDSSFNINSAIMENIEYANSGDTLIAGERNYLAAINTADNSVTSTGTVLNDFRVSEDGTEIATRPEFTYIRIYSSPNLNNNQEVTTPDISGEDAFWLNSNLVAYGTDYGNAIVRDRSDGSVLFNESIGNAVLSLDKEGDKFAATSSGNIKVYDVSNGFSSATETQSISTYSQINMIRYSSDANYLAVSNNDLIILDDNYNEFSRTTATDGGGTITWNGKSSRVAQANNFDNNVGVYDLQSNKITTLSPAGSPNDIDWNLDQFAITSDDYNIYTFNVLAEPTGTIQSPSDGDIFEQQTSIDIQYSADSGAGDGTEFRLDIVKPDSSSETLRTDTLNEGVTDIFTESYNLQEVGNYTIELYVDNTLEDSIQIESIDYTAPSINLNSPTGNLNTYYDSDSRDFSFDINNAGFEGEYNIQLKNSTSSYENVSSGTFSAGDNSVTESVEVQNPSSGTQDKNWRIEVEDSFQTSSSNPATFTVERLPQPDISIEVPSNGEIFYTDSGSTVQVPFEGWVNNSQESGEAFANAERIGGTFSDSIGSVTTGDQYVSGDLQVDTGDYSNGRISVNFNSGATFESNSVNFEVRDGTPTIDSFNVSSDEVSNLENVEPGDFFDFTLEGSKTADDIQSIEYNVDVSGETDPSPVTLTQGEFYQDPNIFTNSLDDAFEMQESWAGSTLDFDVTVTDTEGRTQTDTVTVQTGTPPNNFLLNSPNVGEFFLIPEGQNDVEVDIEYGVDSSELAGDLKLYVNGNNVATQSVGSNTQQTYTFTDTYTEGTQTWYLEWTDSTGETYTSSTSNFEVSQYPVGLSLDSPSEGEDVQILSEPGSVDHDFTVSSDAFTGDWYYEFELTNGNGTVVGSETSTTYSGVEQQFTETVGGIEEGSYTYNVSVLDASDDSEIISKSKSYTTNFDPVFTQEIDSPGDGNTYLVEQGETRNVSYGFSVETFDDATEFTLSLDGNNVRTESVGSQTTDTFTGDFTDLGTGTYNVELSGEDASGRTNTTTASFSVEEATSENESVEINTIEFTPNLDEARPGDELDVYIEGSGVPENVDFVEIELEVAGDVETVIVPTDELQEGSWFWNGENVATVKESWIGATAKVTGTVTDVAGRTSRFFREYIMGVNIEMSGSLETPRDGDVFLQESGEEVNIPFSGSVTSGFDSINYNIQVNDQNLLGGNLGPEESADFSQFFQISDWSLDSYGEFNAQLVLINDATNEKKTYTNTFEIVEDTGQPVVTISNPRQSQQIETPRNEDDAEVTLRYRIQTNETGTTSLVLENLDEGRQEINIDNIDSELSESEAASGESFRTVDITLDEATYLMRASFEDSTGQAASRERTFTVTSDPIEPEEDEEVRLIDPAEGEEIAKNVGTKLRWYAIHEQDIGTPNSTFYVEDSSDTVVFNTTKDAPEVGNMNIYAEYLDANLEPGNYQFYADLVLENETLETERRNLTILDSQAPSTNLQNPDLGVFQQNEEGLANIEAQFTTETFQQDATIELVTRKKGSNDGEVVFSAQQDAFREVIHNADWDEFEAGQYEYYVRMESNPTYTSDTGTYTVEETSFDDPLIELDRPEQGETFTYNDTNASVPFRFDAEAYSQGDTNFTLLLETVSEDNSELEAIDSFTLTETDGLREYSENFELEESGYRYQVVAEYEGETWSSDTRSFVVDNVETAETPELPTSDRGFGILSRISDFGERLLGSNSDFILGFALLMVTSVGVTVRSRSDKIGLATMVAIALGLSYVGVFPSWIAAVFTLISVGISVWTVNLLVGGKGEL